MDYFKKEYFPYTSPTRELRERYKKCFQTRNPVPIGSPKRIFDICFAVIAILIYLPIVILLYIFYLFERCMSTENPGPFLYYYSAVSQGMVFKKYKINALKLHFIDSELASQHLWQAYCNDKVEGCLSLTGQIAKKFYVDEFPQFFSVLWGHMSIVGPRPLSVLHHEKDIENGNICRKYLKGGLIGYGHLHKGTEMMGKSEFEYEYFEKCLDKNSVQLLVFDLQIIIRGATLVLRGGGH